MNRSLSVILFAGASLLPAGLLVAASVYGAALAWAAFLSMTLLVLALDQTGTDVVATPGMARWLPWTVGFAHFAALTATIWAIGQPVPLDLGAKLLMVVATGLYAGQVSNACAHELIHRGDRLSRSLGCAIYCSVLNGQHVSAHLLVHHVHAGTARDPNSAPMGRGFYRFALTACLREFTDGWRVESARRAGRATGLHPYTIYLGGATISLALAGWAADVWGVVALCAVAVHAQMQLLLSDYVQHYGLRRRTGPDGRPEPIGPGHSWNAPQPFSTALMLSATLHSDHHMHPQRPFPALLHNAGPMPTLPFGLPVMGALALIPPLWRRIMDPRVRRLSDAPQDHGRRHRHPIEPLLSE